MNAAKRILIISDIKNKPMKMFVDQTPKLAKGLIRLGHDVRVFSYCSLLSEISPVKSRTISKLLYKKRVDELLARQVKNYKPEIIYINFPRILDEETIIQIRQAAPDAVLIIL